MTVFGIIQRVLEVAWIGLLHPSVQITADGSTREFDRIPPSRDL